MKTFHPSLRLLNHALLTMALCAAGIAYAQDTATSPKASIKGSAAIGSESMSAASFIKAAAQANTAEIALAEVAEQKTQNPEVKQLAQHIRQDHTAANQKLKPIAAKHGIEISQTLEAEQQTKLDQLQGAASGSEFDQMFVKAMLRGHARAISKYEKAAQELQETDVKQYAQNGLPKLKQHLQHSKTAAEKVGIDQATITSLSAPPSAMGASGDTSEKESGKASSKPDANP